MELLLVVFTGALLSYPVFFFLSFVYVSILSSPAAYRHKSLFLYFWCSLSLFASAAVLFIGRGEASSNIQGSPFEHISFSGLATLPELFGVFCSLLLIPFLCLASINIKLLQAWSVSRASELDFLRKTLVLYLLVFVLSSPISALFLYNSRFIVGYLLYPYKFLIEFSA